MTPTNAAPKLYWLSVNYLRAFDSHVSDPRPVRTGKSESDGRTSGKRLDVVVWLPPLYAPGVTRKPVSVYSVRAADQCCGEPGCPCQRDLVDEISEADVTRLAEEMDAAITAEIAERDARAVAKAVPAIVAPDDDGPPINGASGPEAPALPPDLAPLVDSTLALLDLAKREPMTLVRLYRTARAVARDAEPRDVARLDVVLAGIERAINAGKAVRS